MMIDQDVTVTSCGPVTVRVHRGARSVRGVVARLHGDATDEHPLHFVFLVCHADMADEAASETTERLTSKLAADVLARLQVQQLDIRDALQESSAVAAATDRYYSIAAGRVAQHRVLIGAVGHVGATLSSGEMFTRVITPNVVRIGEHEILNGTFGIGFKEEALTAKAFDLARDTTLLVMFGDEAKAPPINSDNLKAEEFIEQAVRVSRTTPPIVAVVSVT